MTLVEFSIGWAQNNSKVTIKLFSEFLKNSVKDKNLYA